MAIRANSKSQDWGIRYFSCVMQFILNSCSPGLLLTFISFAPRLSKSGSRCASLDIQIAADAN